MKRIGALIAAGIVLAATPSFAQTVGTCPRGGGSTQPQPVRILFDLNSSHLRPAEKPIIAQAVKTAKDRQVSAVCLIGHTDKLGDKAYNLKLARARAQTVAAEMIRDGYPANHRGGPRSVRKHELRQRQRLGDRSQGDDLLRAIDDRHPERSEGPHIAVR